MKNSDLPIPTLHSFTLNGVERNYLKAAASDAKNIVIVFHGNGGTAEGFQKKYVLEKHFTSSIVIYLQGIPGIGGGFDPKGLKNGWQRKQGDGDDRDIKAIEILINLLAKEYPNLKNHIWAMGHSNGARFTYLLWHLKTDLFEGFIINAHQGVDLLEQQVNAKPAFVCTGKQDKVVNNANQLKSVEIIKNQLQLTTINKTSEELTVYSNGKGDKVAHYIHAGGHDLPKSVLSYMNEFMNGVVGVF